MSDEVRLFLAGDVMTGRGIDQILPHPGPAELREPVVTDANEYVNLAERCNGPIARPVPFGWPWGNLLTVLEAWAPHVRAINLETSITGAGEFASGKSVHYRMHPNNLPCLQQIRPDVCALANNHVLDFGPEGLIHTLDNARAAGLPVAGAGGDLGSAASPVRVETPIRGVRFASVACSSSGVGPDWAAKHDRPGVWLLPELTRQRAYELVGRVRDTMPGNDLMVISIHWGANWGYELPRSHRRFAHHLIDAGADVVHGHSSHHPRPVEIYRGKLILHGCGDLVNDYEGIGGTEQYRDELRLAYLATIHAPTGTLRDLVLVPLRARRMRLESTVPRDTEWICATMNRISNDLGAHFRVVETDEVEIGSIPSRIRLMMPG